MTLFGGPLPGQPTRPTPTGGLPGAWRAFVERVDPELRVSVPTLTGQGQARGGVELVAGLSVEVGDRVWVVAVDGSRDDLLIVAKRR